MYRLFIALLFLVILGSRSFSQLLTEVYTTYENIPIIVKLYVTSYEDGREISRKLFQIITNEIFNFSYRDGSYVREITEKCYKRFVKMNKDLSTILGRVLYYHSLTKAVSPTLGYLVDLWGFETGRFYVPSPVELSNALKVSSLKNLVISGDSVMLRNKQTKFYLTPFSVGVALLKVKDFLKKSNVTNAFVAVGNNFSLCVGTKDQSGWTVGISNPKNRTENETLLTVSVSNSSVYTASISENSFIEGFKIYHSVLDPKTGYPADNGTVSVSVVDDDPLDAVILARALLVLGKDAGLKFAERRNIKALFVTAEGGSVKMYKTSKWIKAYDRDTTKKPKS
ncbi:MAG: FAD:protein FMN transferase [Brevinematia bacterium]